mmetsp:Transcript_28212/g.35422  ORF Transcript_28212/g.35422 Transcript_28212/m.35422 type:complete len:84 (+) Transcript_28212:1141-1392(+)
MLFTYVTLNMTSSRCVCKLERSSVLWNFYLHHVIYQIAGGANEKGGCHVHISQANSNTSHYFLFSMPVSIYDSSAWFSQGSTG